VLIPVAPSQVVPLDQFVPDLPLVEGPFVCMGIEQLSPNMLAITARYPAPVTSPVNVVVMRDSTGQIIRYSEQRGAVPRVSIPPSAGNEAVGAAIKASVESVRSTVLSIDIRGQRASVMNRGGGQPSVRAVGTVQALGTLASLGKPLERASRIAAECGAK